MVSMCSSLFYMLLDTSLQKLLNKDISLVEVPLMGILNDLIGIGQAPHCN